MGLSFALALLGFAALALAMPSHHRELLGVDCSRGRCALLRIVGAVLLAVSYDRLRVAWGFVEGAIDWLCLAPLAAISIAFLLGIATALRAPERDGGGLQDPGTTAGAIAHKPNPDGKTMR